MKIFRPSSGKRWKGATALLGPLLALAGCADQGMVTVTPPPAGSTQVIGVNGTSLTLNGSTWLPRGVTIQGFVQPLAQLTSVAANAGRLNARINYGGPELAAIAGYHADTIRFQVAQNWLDPNNPNGQYDPKYLGEVTAAITAARSAGFVVMIMLQDEAAVTAEATPHKMPIAETQADWDLLTAAFGTDRGVVLELYNEPQLPNTTANWQLWLNGGTIPGQALPGLGMQPLINHLRAGGAQNVFILDGLNLAHTLNGLPAVSDPLNRLVYAIHPYQNGSADESNWDKDWGIPSMSVPVWADEWSAPTNLMIGLGSLGSYQVAVDLLNYMQLHKIPIGTGAFDVKQFVVQNVPGWTPSNYDNYSPTSTTQGSGALVGVDFATNYGRPLTLADGL